jgi:acyl-coenzyme A synthetase/AMP-(fatty) acid ligase
MEQNAVSLSNALEKSFSSFSDRPCILTSQNEQISFGNYFSLILGLAERLRALGVRQGQLVAVNLKNYEFSLALRLAVLRLGAINTPVIAAMASGMGAVDISKVISHKAHPIGHPREVFFSPDWLRAPSGYAPIVPGGGIIHATSGSTGVPKLRFDTESVFFARLSSNKAARGKFSGPVLNMQNVATLIGQKAAIGALLEGKLQLSARETDTSTLEMMSKFDITDMYAPPLILKKLQQRAVSEKFDFSSLLRINMGGGAVSNDFARSIEKLFGCMLWSDYGSTETDTIALGRMALADQDRTIFTEFYPGVKIKVSEGAESLIRVWIPSERRTSDFPSEEPLFDNMGWRELDDLGKINHDRSLEVFGRASDIINAGGNKIAPHTIEAFLEEQPDVKEVAAFRVATGSRIDDIGIAVVFHKAPNPEHIEIIVKNHFGTLYSVHVHAVDKIPKSESGKVLRRVLSEKYVVCH